MAFGGLMGGHSFSGKNERITSFLKSLTPCLSPSQAMCVSPRTAWWHLSLALAAVPHTPRWTPGFCIVLSCWIQGQIWINGLWNTRSGFSSDYWRGLALNYAELKHTGELWPVKGNGKEPADQHPLLPFPLSACGGSTWLVWKICCVTKQKAAFLVMLWLGW